MSTPDKGGRVALTEIESEYSIPADGRGDRRRAAACTYGCVSSLDLPLPGNSAAKLGPGIDTRCVGGYVVVPPSTVVQSLADGRNHFGSLQMVQGLRRPHRRGPLLAPGSPRPRGR